jgi:protein TonB
MTRLRISHFIAISLALHVAALLAVRHEPPAMDWIAGPVIVRLIQLSGSTRQSRTTDVEKVARKSETRPVTRTPAATAAQKRRPQHGPARIPVANPVVDEKPTGTGATTAAAQRRAAESASRTAALEQRLLASLRAALLPHFSYPLLARRRGWEGIVRVGVRVEANGSLTRLHLVEPCPYDVLNTAAINSLAQLARLPNAGNWLQGSHVDLVLPVEYRLLEG